MTFDNENPQIVTFLIAFLRGIEDHERLSLFSVIGSEFCTDCGRDLKPGGYYSCHCMNDE